MVIAPSYTQLPDRRLRCEEHGETFGPLDTCKGCDAARAPAAVVVVDAADDIPPPDGCRSAEEHERQFTALAEYATKLSRETAEGTPKRGRRAARKPNPQLAVKIMAEATKARRAASALARAREDDALLLRLEKLRARRRGSN